MMLFTMAFAVGTMSPTSRSKALNTFSVSLMLVSLFSSIATYCRVQDSSEVLANLLGEANRDGVSDLRILRYLAVEVAFERVAGATDAARRAFAHELIPVGEQLEPCPFANSEDSWLGK